MNPHGIAGHPAPEWRVDSWLSNVESDAVLHIADITEPVIYLHNFQAWCPGCHSHGFPTMKAVSDALVANGSRNEVRFVAIQTVFEGHDTNTAAAAVESLERHGLDDISLGHDSGHPPTIMSDYRTGGTPWTVIIGPDRSVLADGFTIDVDHALDAIHRAIPDNNNQNETTMNNSTDDAVTFSESELRDRLTPEQYDVTRNGATERAYTGEYWNTKDAGVYRCVVCETDLFDSDTKFDSGTGWPSFFDEIAGGRVTRIEDRKFGMTRTEARCAVCDSHLGHVFPDGPRPTGERYCMNSASLTLAGKGNDDPGDATA